MHFITVYASPQCETQAFIARKGHIVPKQRKMLPKHLLVWKYSFSVTGGTSSSTNEYIILFAMHNYYNIPCIKASTYKLNILLGLLDVKLGRLSLAQK